MLLVATASIAMLASCKKDNVPADNSNWVEENFVGVTYNDESGLSLSYSGTTMPGKTATVTTCDEKTITISLKGEKLAMNEEGYDAMPVPQLAFATAGVFPGEVESIIAVPYVKSGNALEFSTKIQNDSYTYDIAGNLSKGNFVIDITNVTVAADAAFAGKKLNLVNYDENGESIPADAPISLVDSKYPFHALWDPDDASLNIDLGFGPIPFPLNTIMRLAFVMPIIEVGGFEDAFSITTALQSVLKGVEFMADGNVVATINDLGAASSLKSPLNIAHYYVLNDHQLKLYLHPYAIDDEDELVSKADQGNTDLTGELLRAVSTLMQAYTPMLSEGVVLQYKTYEETGVTTVYLGDHFFKPLGDVIGSLLANEELVALLIETIKSDESMGSYAGLIEGILPQIPELVKNCKAFELGLNFTAAE